MSKTIIVTGASGGIGKEIARALAADGAKVVLAVRDRARGEAARNDIAATTKNPRVTVRELDVADIGSIRRFADEWSEPLDVLVNNAGAWFSDRRVSPDGHELTLATNVIGPFLLTELLLPSLRAARGRVVNVVSGLAANYDATDLQFSRRKYDGFKSYAQSKAALRMLTRGLAEREREITVNCAAPGFVRTEFNRNASGFVATTINVMARLFGADPAKGAKTPVWVATAPELAGVTGKYFDDAKEKDGKFPSLDAIAELEAYCREVTSLRRAA
jgi:NAD(P)-dependent dehydrogenase (short-subunit alcohol dehydrogenase family)